VLAFADVPAQQLGLIEREPELRTIASKPKQEDVDAPVGLLGD